MKVYQHVLLATDLSDTCLKAAVAAQKIAEASEAKFSIAHCVEPIPAYGYPGFQELQSPLIDHAKQELDTLAQQIGVPVNHVHLLFGTVKTEVLKFAEEHQVDLIIVGSHTRRGLSRLLGSNANAIVHGADCDVLTIRCDA